MMFSISIIKLFFTLMIFPTLYSIKSGVHQCTHITRKLSKQGDGSTSSSCLSCDPALPVCHGSCQAMVDQMYRVCDDVCLPYNYYYDPNYHIKGCWRDIKPEIKIAVERCGCNSGASLSYAIISHASVIITFIVLIIYH